MPRRIAVIGAGAWGTALAAHACRLGHEARLWTREAEVAADVNTHHENRVFLGGVALPKELRASTDAGEVLSGAEVVLFVPPSQFLGSVAERVAAHVPADARIVIASKGIEQDSLALMHDVAARSLPGHEAKSICALSGPSFAREVAAGLPTDVVVAAKDAAAAQFVADALHSPMFRVYTSRDPVGVEEIRFADADGPSRTWTARTGPSAFRVRRVVRPVTPPHQPPSPCRELT